MEFIKEFYILVGRIITIFPLMLFITLYMGKRSIGELPIFDFLVIVILGAVVGADIADPEIEHIHTAVAIVLIGIFQRVVSKLKIKYRKLGHIITFEPTVVIQDGQLIGSNLKNIRYSIDNILQMLREKDIFDLSEVHLGIVEANGNMSVLKHPDKTEVTKEDMNLTKKTPSLSFPVIIDGNISTAALTKLDLSEAWLKDQLAKLDINNVSGVFFASVNTKNELHVSLKNYKEAGSDIFPIYN